MYALRFNELPAGFVRCLEFLVGETSKQVDLFKAQPQQIKENIEKLIEKNIIKRNGASYEYIA